MFETATVETEIKKKKSISNKLKDNGESVKALLMTLASMTLK